MIGGARLVYLAAVSWSAVIAADVERSRQVQQQQQQRLAVIVPTYRGDLQRAVSSLERWPTICSLVTQSNVDIVLYYAEGEEDADDVYEASETIAQTAGQCFSRTRTVYANLDEEDDFYPKGPSVQFYKMFLDEDVRSQLAEYDALAIVEWDVLVADDSSFEELYRAAFSGADDFWVKGSNVGGTNFHSTAEVQEMWHVLGHINGNAIYNNNDADFVEYVEYTRARWEYEYPYDVALWLTISDFPYSWPLWQRYSGKFVTTNLISYVGTEHVDSSSVSDAVAGHTLFIHGSRVDDGNIASRKAASEQAAKRRTNKFSAAINRKRNRQRKRKQRRLQSPETEEDEGGFPGKGCTSACGSSEGGDDASGLPEGTSTVCDDSCAGNRSRFDGFLCGAGDADKYGAMCRLCFTDVEEARGVQRVLAKNSNGMVDERVIMCDTMKPPEDVGCSAECNSKSYTVCDSSCGSGRYGDYDCNWRGMGEHCRFCFDDVDAAFAADEIARGEGGRVIMCSTMEPPLPTPEEEGNELVPGAVLGVDQSRRMQDWRESEKWKTNEKWKIIEKYKMIEKFKELRKWEYTLVLPDIPDVCAKDYCPHISGDGKTGRICDENCASGIYGTLGCGTRDGIYGFSCRLCYTDQDAALAADDFVNNDRAIMCATALPVDIYASRRLEDKNQASALIIGRKLEKLKGRSDWGGRGRPSEVTKEMPQAAEEAADVVYRPPENQLKLPREDNKLKQVEVEDEGFPGKGCTSACGSSEGGDDDASGLPEGTSTVCDDSCAGNRGRFDGFLCGAGDADKYGAMCRLCFTDVEEAHGVQRVLAENSNGTVNERVIMCDTMKPPEDVGCSAECHSKSYTVCDSSCGSERYGDYDCNWRGMGEHCRFCFDDMDAAFAADEIARREGGRVIMCSTMEPPLPTPEEEGNKLVPVAVSRVDQSRRMQDWRESEKWKIDEKWKIIEKYKMIEKFKDLRKWEYTLVLPDIPDVCAEDYCPHISGDGKTGRICDENCASGIYGTLGCGTRDGIYGFSCRLCYTDQDAALAADDFVNNDRAIMCATALPVDIYASRRLTSAEPESAASIGRKLKGKKERLDDTAVVAMSTIPDNIPENSSNNAENDSELAKLFVDLSQRRFVEGVTRGEMCAFMAGREEEVNRWQVTVSSILQFLPGMRVAVAVEGDPKVYQRAIGNFPGVVVRDTPDADLASLYADKFCGPGTSLIYYAEADSVISRTFTSKDTHSPNGDLLVVYSEPRSRRAHELSSLTNAVLGFKSPSFTQGADLILPVGANAALREKVLSTLGGSDEMGEAAVALREMGDVDDIDAIPQIMAALQFSKNPLGLWFLNPQKWVAEHLFKPVSIWEIPLVKPRFGCTLPVSTSLVNSPAEELQRSLEFFSHGGKCENGLIAVEGGS